MHSKNHKFAFSTRASLFFSQLASRNIKYSDNERWMHTLQQKCYNVWMCGMDVVIMDFTSTKILITLAKTRLTSKTFTSVNLCIMCIFKFKFNCAWDILGQYIMVNNFVTIFKLINNCVPKSSNKNDPFQ